MKLLAAGPTVNDLFGQVTPPPGSSAFANPITGLSTLLVIGIRIFLLLGGLTTLIYLLWGAYEWITSAGDKDRLTEARHKLTNAALGFVISVAILGLFSVISGDILGIIKRTPDGGWIFNLPSINPCIQTGLDCNIGSSNCCGGLSCQTMSVYIGVNLVSRNICAP